LVKLVGSLKNVLDSVLFLRFACYRLKVGFYFISWFLLSWYVFRFLASVALTSSFVFAFICSFLNPGSRVLWILNLSVDSIILYIGTRM